MSSNPYWRLLAACSQFSVIDIEEHALCVAAVVETARVNAAAASGIDPSTEQGEAA